MVCIQLFVNFVPLELIVCEFHQNSTGCRCYRWSDDGIRIEKQNTNNKWMATRAFFVITWAILGPYLVIASNNTLATDIRSLYNGGILRPLQSLVSLLKLVANIFNRFYFNFNTIWNKVDRFEKLDQKDEMKICH